MNIIPTSILPTFHWSNFPFRAIFTTGLSSSSKTDFVSCLGTVLTWTYWPHVLKIIPTTSIYFNIRTRTHSLTHSKEVERKAWNQIHHQRVELHLHINSYENLRKLPAPSPRIMFSIVDGIWTLETSYLNVSKLNEETHLMPSMGLE